ncbi:MAG: UDP-N-acetylglucosamine diphosphorylase/glucosamine-1-phosphate N-acetyltransferase [Campylobacteraceae bacterium 4484_166]|nr:MAG: UDP-N-acetylglucosamine diphosphorylase/glucosamine-1-phosphate N-acetyltransferase [Campylobacteraceae bacterium 4484_166]
MKKDISIVILSAGAGSRMLSKKAKVLHEISGKPMLYYSIFEALKISDDITVVLFHQANRIKEKIDEYFKNNNIKYITQDHKNYPGTGGAMMNLKFQTKKCLVLNGDMPLVQYSELEKLISTQNEVMTMSIFKLKDASGYGRVKIEDGKVVKIIEQKDCTKEELEIKEANAGVYCFDVEFLAQNLPKLNNKNAQKEYYITDLVTLAIKEEKNIKVVVVDEQNFKGVNNKLDLSFAEVLHQNRIKKQFMLQGVVMRLPDTIYIEDGVKIIGECVIENCVTIKGNTTIQNSHIVSNSIIENSIIKDSTIGPYARIRPQSDITNTHIGNFVEIKKSTLTGTKAGHLSYIGDTNIAQGSNIGAGTITCNYDGLNKHKTTIGQNVFIGSGTQLIAPLKIEDDSIVGAGSTITKDIKSGELVLTRAKTKIVKNYFFKFFGKKK